MNYSPKLRQAMEEFKALLKKHDIAGTIILFEAADDPKQGGDFSEYYMGVDASWSCAHNEKDQIRIRSRLDQDYNGDKAKRDKEARATAAMLVTFMSNTEFIRGIFAKLRRLVDGKWDITVDSEEIFPGTDR